MHWAWSDGESSVYPPSNGLDGGVLCSRMPQTRSDLGRARFGLTYARFGTTYVEWLGTPAALLSDSNRHCSPIGRLNSFDPHRS